MKNLRLSFHYITLFIFCQVISLLGLSASAFAANVNDFYFESYDADYYVTLDEDGRSNMHVKETLTAVFPNTDQNHGIDRTIPYTSDNTRNVTVPSENALNLKLKINGVSSTPYSVKKEDGYYTVRIGSPSTYVHGKTVYELEYDYKNVALSYTAAGQTTYIPAETVSQEIYWDTNGTGWSQKFEKLNVRVHLPDAAIKNLTGDVSCYVGRYGSKNGLNLKGNFGKNSYTETLIGDGGCTIKELGDGFAFAAQTELPAHGNLTFDIEFEKDTFLVEATENYILVFIVIGLAILLIIITILAFKSRAKYSEKRNFYKTSPTPPQYAPEKYLSIGQAANLSIKSCKNDKVANLIALALDHKIELEKGKKKFLGGHEWIIHVKDLTDVSLEQRYVLQILNAGEEPVVGADIIVKTQRYDSTVALCARSYDSNIEKALKSKGLIEKKKDSLAPKVGVILAIVFGAYGAIALIGIMLSLLDEALASTPGIVIGVEVLPFVIFSLIISLFAVPIIITHDNGVYKKRTMKGLESVVYLNGLRLYMEMAEADRIKFLQSVEGADTSNQGIVKFFEKLLPYAILFGIEDSWLDELNKYYEMEDVADPTWYAGGYLMLSDLRAFNVAASRSISSGSTTSDSGGGGSSSSSGGGGGGFSGGGGGGGGGGGW